MQLEERNELDDLEDAGLEFANAAITNSQAPPQIGASMDEGPNDLSSQGKKKKKKKKKVENNEDQAREDLEIAMLEEKRLDMIRR